MEDVGQNVGKCWLFAILGQSGDQINSFEFTETLFCSSAECLTGHRAL